jgi:ribonuclease T
VQAAGLTWDANEAHSAVYDTERTAQLFCTVMNRWRHFSGSELAAGDPESRHTIESGPLP